MKCPKCGNEIKPTAKFCTYCGTRLIEMSQPNANYSQPSDTEEKGFIDNSQQAAQEPKPSNQPESAQQQNNGQNTEPVSQIKERPEDSIANSVRGFAIWNIQKGEIARRITESEFANVEGLKGVIIQEGCKAHVFIDGQFVAEMEAGAYTFPTKSETERRIEQAAKDLQAEQKELDKQRAQLAKEQKEKEDKEAASFRSRGVFGEIAAFGRGIRDFFLGKKKDETDKQHTERVERICQRISTIPSPKRCRVYIISNRMANLVFAAAKNGDGDVSFEPMRIPTKLINIKVAVTLQAKITDFNLFVTNYLADQNSVSVMTIEQLLEPAVKAKLTQTLRNLDYDQYGLPGEVVENLKGKLRLGLNDILQGMEVVRVNDITDSSEDFERFRSVERELFASEKELDFLHRTGEFRNRLEQEQNQQKLNSLLTTVDYSNRFELGQNKQQINSAANAENLANALQEINKDGLLREDELSEFKLLLESQKRIREAKTKEEEYEALADMKRSRLVKDDDIAALENTLAQGIISRENVTDLMRVQAMQKLDMAQQIAEFEISDGRREHKMADELRNLEHQGHLVAAQLDTQHLEDAYDDERNEFNWKRAFERKRQEDDYDFENESREIDRDFLNKVRASDYNWSQEERRRAAEREQAKFEADLQEQAAQNQYNRIRQGKMDDISILERKGEIARRNMQDMLQHGEAMADKKNQHEETMHEMDVKASMHHDNVTAGMTAEQLREIRRENLSEAAQVASFKTEEAKYNADNQQKMADFYKDREEESRINADKREAADREESIRREREAAAREKDDKDRMERMFNTFGTNMVAMGQQQITNQQMANAQQIQYQQNQYNQQHEFDQQRIADQTAMKNEYRENAQYQQSRMDHTQDQAMGSMSQINTAAAGNLYTNRHEEYVNVQYDNAQEPVLRRCPNCGTPYEEGAQFCEECCQKLR